MMVVMPAFAESEDAKDRVIPALIRRLIGPPAPDVADRVDAPGDMVQQAGANQPAPEHSGKETPPAMPDQAADRAGNNPSQEKPDPEPAIDKAQHRVGHQIANALGQLRRLWCEQPPEMRVPHSAKHFHHALSMQMRRM